MQVGTVMCSSRGLQVTHVLGMLDDQQCKSATVRPSRHACNVMLCLMIMHTCNLDGDHAYVYVACCSTTFLPYSCCLRLATAMNLRLASASSEARRARSAASSSLLISSSALPSLGETCMQRYHCEPHSVLRTDHQLHSLLV